MLSPAPEKEPSFLSGRNAGETRTDPGEKAASCGPAKPQFQTQDLLVGSIFREILWRTSVARGSRVAKGKTSEFRVEAFSGLKVRQRPRRRESREASGIKG